MKATRDGFDARQALREIRERVRSILTRPEGELDPDASELAVMVDAMDRHLRAGGGSPWKGDGAT